MRPNERAIGLTAGASFTKRDELNQHLGLDMDTQLRIYEKVGCSYSYMPWLQQQLNQTSDEVIAWANNNIPWKNRDIIT